MNCQEVQESLGDHSVGLLEPDRQSAIEQHMAICAECAQSWRQFQRCMDLLDHVARPEPPDDLWLGVRARLELEKSLAGYAQVSPMVPPPPQKALWWSGAMAAMAGFATAAGILVLLSSQSVGSGAVAAAAPMAVSVSQHTTLDGNSPMADGASIVAADAVSLRTAPGAGTGMVIVPGREVLGEPSPMVVPGRLSARSAAGLGEGGR